MKLSLVFVTVGVVAAVSAACSSQGGPEASRTTATTTTTITSAPVEPSSNVTATAEPTAPPAVATEPAATTEPARPSRDSTPATAPQATAAATATARTASPSSTTRPPRKGSDLVERGQLVGPSLAPQQPIVIFPSSQQGSATSSPGYGRPTESPSDFSPKPRDAAPNMGGQITSFTGSAPVFNSSSTTSRGF